MLEKDRLKKQLRFKDDYGNDFPEWEVKTLGEVAIKKSSNISANKIEENFGEYIIYGASGVLKKVDFFEEENDYISIIKDGAGVGRIFYCKGKSSVLGTMEIIKPRIELNTYFLYCLLDNIDFTKYITGSTIPHIYFKDYSKEKCGIPTLEEQTKIANFLSSIDEKITKMEQELQELKSYKKGVMQLIFDNKNAENAQFVERERERERIRFKDENGNAYPKWEVKTLGEITKIYDGTHQTPDYKKEGIPFYSVEHITSNNFSNTKYISKEVFDKENQKVKLEKGDILMTKIGDIGTVKYINWEVNASFYVSLALIKRTDKHNNEYLYHFINSEFFQSELHKRIIHVAFPKKINLGEIGDCIVKLPVFEEQTKIANFLTGIDDKINSSQAQIEQTQHYKKGLLQNMFV